jgi:hypothetical protein
MTQADYDAFSQEYKRISAALERYKQSPAELATKIDAYFHVLKGFPLSEVIAKADGWLGKETKMPKPAEWANVIARKAADVPLMPERDAREWRKAEQSRWQAEPCGCQSCVEAGVNEKPLRFVPVDDRMVIEPLSQRVVNAGRWAHGWELFRWYQARADFYNRCLELGLKGDKILRPKDRRSFQDKLAAIFPARVAVGGGDD